MNVLIIAREHVAEFVSEREALPRRDVRGGQNDQLDVVGRDRQAVKAGSKFDDGHIDAEHIFGQDEQIAVADRAARLADTDKGFLRQLAALLEVAACAKSRRHRSPGLPVTERGHVLAQRAVVLRRVKGSTGIAARGPGGYRQWPLLPGDQPIHRDVAQFGDAREVQ